MTSRCASLIDTDENADKVADLLRFLAPSLLRFGEYDKCETSCARYHHMGALLADTALQAAVKYASVVKPRVDAILAHYPEAVTVSSCISILERISAADFLRWRHPSKPQRFVDLLVACAEEGVDSVADLADWVITPNAQRRLRNINGIGPKSVDYIQMLSGNPSAPMDRHLLRIVSMAGVSTKDYSVAQRAFVEGASRAGFCVSYAERTVWQLVSACS
jgi:hypothetical protein